MNYNRERHYLACYWIGDDHDEIEYISTYRAGSKKNREDAMKEIALKKGRRIARVAEIYGISLLPED